MENGISNRVGLVLLWLAGVEPSNWSWFPGRKRAGGSLFPSGRSTLSISRPGARTLTLQVSDLDLPLAVVAGPVVARMEAVETMLLLWRNNHVEWASLVLKARVVCYRCLIWPASIVVQHKV